MTFQQLVESLYTKTKLTSSQIAHKLECNVSTIWRWRKGICEPRPEAMEYWIKKIKRVCK